MLIKTVVISKTSPFQPKQRYHFLRREQIHRLNSAKMQCTGPADKNNESII